MSLSYRALAVLLSYPSEAVRERIPGAAAVLADEARIPLTVRRALAKLAASAAASDLLEQQE